MLALSERVKKADFEAQNRAAILLSKFSSVSLAPSIIIVRLDMHQHLRNEGNLGMDSTANLVRYPVSLADREGGVA